MNELTYTPNKSKPRKSLVRSPMARKEWKRVPGTARKTLKAKRESPTQLRFKREVRERDNFTCQFPSCGVYDLHIDVHHIAKRSQRPDLKLVTSNAICLCRKHHSWTDTNHDEAVRLGLLSTESYEKAQKELVA